MGLLVFIAFIPILLARWNDNKMFSQVTVEKVEERNALTTQKSKLNTREKVKLLYENKFQDQSFVIFNQHHTRSKEYNDEIKEKVAKEIKKFQNLELLPQFEFNDEYENNIFETVTYTKATDPESCVVVTQMSFNNNYNSINIWLDGNDYTIYQCTFYTENNNVTSTIKTTNREVISHYGIDYLGLSEEEVKEYCKIIINKKFMIIGVLN